MATKVLPALRGPEPDPALLLVGEQVDGGWQYECSAMCGATCVVRRRWAHRGNKSNGWGVYRWLVGKQVGTFCPPCAVAETRDRARMAAAS